MANLLSELKAGFPADLWEMVLEAGKVADKKNLPAVVVGGVVRDVLLQKTVVDADIMVEDPAQPVVEALSRAHQAKMVSHERFKTFTLHYPSGHKIDVVTAREERYPSPGALPVVSPSNIDSDLKRRDFSVNAMACSINQKHVGDLLDPFKGRSDLDAKLIRALHAKSFMDDPTRIYRAARFAGRFGFQVESQTLEWIRKAIEQNLPDVLSPTRRRHEFELILKEANPIAALSLLEGWEALRFFHRDWRLHPEHLQCMVEWNPNDPISEILVRRLVHWFKPWGAAKAQQMMTDLSFEKAVKKDVQALLIRR